MRNNCCRGQSAGAINYTYDANDRLGSDQYDANGNTTLSGGVSDGYDFENHLIQKGGVTIVYDGDGNRVSETVAGVTTNYLVDTVNPTGYAQVVDELQNGTVTRTYAYGLERLDEDQNLNGTWTASFYGYDGHGSVRQLTSVSGTVTDSYDYDAFGNLINQTGSTPNNYLFASEQYDPALGLYYNRARYLNTTTGRFINMDRYEGNDESPLSLHKYLYAGSNPVDRIDPSGREFDLTSFTIASAASITIASMAVGGIYTRSLQGIVSGGEGGALLGLSLVVGDPRLRVRTFAGAFTNAAWQYFANLYANYVADTLGQPEKPEQQERELVVEAFAAGAAGGYGSYLFQDVLFPGSDYAAGFSGVFNALETAFAQGKCAKDACVSAAISFVTAFGSSYTGATNAFDPAGPVIKQLINTAFTKTFSTFAKPTLINFLKSIGADNLVDSLSCP